MTIQYLINPFPIFSRHLTIVSGSYSPSAYRAAFPTMLEPGRGAA
ncbi:MAG: DUF4922 domain-containing protein [Marinilabiliales bacterium]|nr:DUF4922 domain-containing protein [Marinilabiliales bacterium]